MQHGENDHLSVNYFDHDNHDRFNFAILTTNANDVMQPIHERMPVILPLGSETIWPPEQPSGMEIFPPFPAELMTAYPVTPKMNKASFNEPEATAPLEHVLDQSVPANVP